MTPLLAFLVRFLQAGLAASLYVLCGLLLAGVFRLLVGHARLRTLLKGDSLSGPIRGWALGSLLPVCSLGVLPVVRESLRAGVDRRTVFALLLAAPLFHPLTLAYALSVMDVSLLATLLAASLIVVSCAARFVAESSAPPESDPTSIGDGQVSYGLKRMAAIGAVAADNLNARYRGEILLGLVGAGLIGALLSSDSIGGALSAESAWAAPVSCGLGTVLYMTPEQSVAVLDQMFGHGNSLAAAFALLICGVGLNVGTLLAVKRLFGTKSLVVAMTVILLGVTVVGSLANATVYQPTMTAGDDHAGHEGTGHTHAFDAYATPVSLSDPSRFDSFLRLVQQSFNPLQTMSLLMLILVAFTGVCFRSERFRVWLAETPQPTASSDSVMSRPLSIRLLSVLAGIGCVVVAYFAALVYFPDHADAFADMQSAKTRTIVAVRADDPQQAVEQLSRWEALARKLPMGALLRGTASGDRRVSAQILRQHLGELQSAVKGDDPERVATLLAECNAAYQQCRDVYNGEPLVLHAAAEAEMPDKITDSAEQELYLTPGGIYTEADIEANGRQTASQRFVGFRSSHDMNPAVGALICPITETKANPECTWIVNGKSYQFCCPPCVDEFVRRAKEDPDAVREPEDYVKR